MAFIKSIVLLIGGTGVTYGLMKFILPNEEDIIKKLPKPTGDGLKPFMKKSEYFLKKKKEEALKIQQAKEEKELSSEK